jgi:hypothetical protein
MKRTAVTSMAIVVTVFALIAPASASATHVHPIRAAMPSASSQFWCDSGTPAPLCLRDPSDGGAGTKVKMAFAAAAGSELWTRHEDPQACGGFGVVEPGCDGLPSSITNRYAADSVVYLEQNASGKCIKFSSDTSWEGAMGTCGDTNTLLIQSKSCPGGLCFYPAIAASARGQTVLWMCGNESGQPPFVAVNCGNFPDRWAPFN